MSAHPARDVARPRRFLKAVVSATAALTLAFAGLAVSPGAQVAQADPSAAASTTTISATGAYSGTVPAGICTVTATVLGAAGGSPVTTAPNANGAGARVTATYPVVPGLAYSGIVGGGGAGATSGANAGGSNGGGNGGVAATDHHGGGGGGSTTFNLGGAPAIVAGGGGGAGGGHSTTTNGQGGNAGLPSGSGIANGSTGNVGRDTPTTTVVGGGVGGSGTFGAGGVNSADGNRNGLPGTNAGVGGNGGTDPNYDAGGGGGAGYRGGGGGASTVVQNSGTLEIAGAGGGGGSSYVEPSVPLGAGTSTPSAISSILGAKQPAAGNGANGSVSLVWNPCVYDLAVDKSVAPVNTPINGTVTWTVTVTNLGPSAMTQGDTVTLTDTLPGAGAKTITAISVSGGSNAILGRGAVTCTAAVGAAMPASLDCSRPYQIGAGAASGVRGLDVGETLTVTYTQAVSEAVGTTLTNTATVVDRQAGDTNDSGTAATTVVAPPGAIDDVRSGNAIGAVVNVPVTTNDTGTLQSNSVILWNPAGAGSSITSPYVVAGQGTWTVASDIVTFTPAPGFKGDPTPVTYRVTATNGLSATATVTITYVPTATDDIRNNLVIGTATTVDVLTNDDGSWDATTLRVLDPASGTYTTGPVTIAGQGVWTISGSNVVFTPAPGFLTDPTPRTYRITDTTGDQVTATVTLNYVPAAANDSSLGNTLDLPINVNVLTNDTGSFTVGSLVFVSSLGTTLNVPGEGVWTVQPGGVIRFTPAVGYKGDPTPVGYRITDITGDTVTATVTVAYVPAAIDDASLGNAMGTTVSVNVLANDNGDWAAGNVRLMNGLLPVSSLLVPGQGTWSVVGDAIQFVPLPGFLTDPTPITYRVTDTTGDFATATLTVAYLPQAADDSVAGLVIGSPATVHPLNNDTGDWTVSTLRLVDPGTGNPVTGPVVVGGQGTWTIAGSDIIFTPAPGFVLDPTPIGYRITDSTGDTATATISLDYSPHAVNDSSLGNAIGAVVDLSVLTNDIGDFDPTTLGFGPGNVGVGATLNVPGQGVWTVQAGGVIRFTPEPGFLTDPTPQTYIVRDTLGDPTSALMTVGYLPAAANDSSPDNTFGSTVNVDVLGNDTGVFVAGTVSIMDIVLPVASLYVAGQGTWVVQPDDSITFIPDPGFLTDPAPIHYRVQDTTGDFATAVVTVTYLPLAIDDAQGGLAIGSGATVPVLDNDLGDFVVATLRLVDPSTATPTASPVTVPGQGVWSISGANVVFTPAPGFLVDPDPISYRITDSTGDTTSADVELDYGPGAADDSSPGNTIGQSVDVSVFANDSGTFDPATLGFGGATGPGATLVVAGEGTWTVLAGGVVRFTPDVGFLVDPTPVTYYADDITGDPASAQIAISYVPSAADDSDLGNALGTAVNVDVLGNDIGSWAAGSVFLLDGVTPTASFTVPGEGTWTVQLDDTITFVPEPGFLTDPTVVSYQVTDSTGDVASAQLTVTYLPAAADDSDLGNTLGSTVNVPVLSNDSGDFVLSSVRIVTPGGPQSTLVVAGEGTWRANNDGTVTFVPEAGFLLDPAPIDYEVTDTTGDTVGGQLTITYLPTVAPDQQNGFAFGAPATLQVLNNDTGDFDVTSLRIIDPGTNLGVLSLTVPGEGEWTVDNMLGRLTFTPGPGYLGNPTPVHYEVTDLSGDVVRALATVTYLPTASDDQSLDNPSGTTVTVPILPNDVGLFDPASARLMDPNATVPVPALSSPGSSAQVNSRVSVRMLAPVMTMSVAGQGTWRMNTSTPSVSFQPLPSFRGNPTPVTYRVTDVNGNFVTADVTITYVRSAGLALTGMEVKAPLMGALGAIVLGLFAVVIARLRRTTARHRV